MRENKVDLVSIVRLSLLSFINSIGQFQLRFTVFGKQKILQQSVKNNLNFFLVQSECGEIMLRREKHITS